MSKIKFIILYGLILFFGCKTDKKIQDNLNVKCKDSDYFKNTIIESQLFKIYSKEDNVIESDKGNILIIPSGSLIDDKGKIVKDSIQIEFAEATEVDEIILSNLMIQDSVNIYESALSFYFNATRKGEQLQINPENPIYFELPHNKRVELYKGERDELGEMTWSFSIRTVDYLVPVLIDLLDFYPEGFEQEVEKGLPYKNHEIKTRELLDSLYYSFAAELDKAGYYSGNDLFLMIDLITPVLNLLAYQEDEWQDSSIAMLYGINPASIKAIRGKKFQNTLISTREFENRLRAIFATCDNQVLELYINNLDKNLWEIDKMVADLLKGYDDQYSKFLEFASYKQGKVKLSNRRAKLLSKHYKKRKEKIEKEIYKLKQEFLDKKKKQEEIARKKKEEYKELLKARYKYRMNKFGFELKEFGWYNAAHKIKLEDIEKFKLNLTINNGTEYERVYAYVINPKIKSIFSYFSKDKTTFDIVYIEDPTLLLWKNQKFNILGVGYKNGKIGYNIRELIQHKQMDVNLDLVSKDVNRFKKDIKEFTIGYKKENKIMVDLEYQAFFYKEQKRKEREKEGKIFMNKLREKVFPCCDWSEQKPVADTLDVEVEIYNRW